MDTGTILLVGAAVYFYLQSKGAAPAPRAPQPSGGLSTPQGFSFAIPGVVTYQNVYGVGTQVAVNPDFFSSLFGGGGAPQLAAPGPAPDYNQQYDYDVTFG